MKIVVDLEETPCPYASVIASEVRCFADNKQPMSLLGISDQIRTLNHIPKCDKTKCPKNL